MDREGGLGPTATARFPNEMLRGHVSLRGDGLLSAGTSELRPAVTNASQMAAFFVHLLQTLRRLRIPFQDKQKHRKKPCR